MISKEQFATVTEVLATASVVGVGWALGGTVGAAIMAGIGINLGSDIIQKGSTHLKEKWISAKYGVLNHDIQRALARAFVKALASLEARYFELPEANSQPTEKKKAIRGLFKELTEQGPSVFAGSVEKVVSGQEVKEYLYGEPQAAKAKLWERVEGTKLLYTYYGEHFREFLRDNINNELMRWFHEELKADNRECNKAWRAFQWMLLEGIQADVKAVHANQEAIRQDLQVLGGIRTQLDELKDTIDRRVAGEPFQQGLEKSLQSITALLENVGGTTQRTEKKVDVLVGVSQRTEKKIDTVVAALSAKSELKTKNPSDASDTHSALSLALDLPPSLHGFIGRSLELAELELLLEKNSAVNVEGLSGIGKTSLTLSLADRWLRSGRLGPNSLFYFDCAQRNMRLGVASEFLLRNLAAFFAQAGETEVANIVANEEQPLDHRYNAVSSTLMRGRFLVILDNLQDALDESRRIASQSFADLLYFVLSRPLANSRFICASYVQCSWSSRLSIQPYQLNPLSAKDARKLLLSLGLEDFKLANRAAQLVGRHPQAIRWFSLLPRELGLSVEEVINDLSNEIDHDATGFEFQQRIEDELLKRIWDTLPNEAGCFLSLCTVFRRPVPFKALSALMPTPQVDRWRQILIDRFLLDASTRDGPHSLHDLVRNFAARRIHAGSDKWRGAHQVASAWWEAIGAASVQGTHQQLEAQTESHYHLVSAGDTDKAHAVAMRLRRVLGTAGRHSYRRGLKEENEFVHRASVQITPNDPQAHLYLAGTLSRLGNKEAEFHFLKALELDPKFSLARHRYAQFLVAHSRNEDAEEQFRQSLKNEPENGRNHVRYATFLASINRFDDAEVQFRLGLDLEPEAAELRNVYALFLARSELHWEAEKQFDLALKTQPNNAAVLESYGKFLIYQGRPDEAERYLSKAIEIDSKSIHQLKAYFKLPLRNRRIEVVRTALKALTKIGSRDPSLRRKYLELFLQYATPEQVDSEIQAALSAKPRSAYVRNLYIKHLISKGRINDAEQQFKAGIHAAPNSVSSRNSYAAFLARGGRHGEAEEQFGAAITGDPENIGAYGPYIEFLSRRRKFDEANGLLRTMRQINASHVETQRLASFVNRQELVLRAPSTQEERQKLIAVLRENMIKLELPLDDRMSSCKAILREIPDDFRALQWLGRTIMFQLKDASAAEPYLLRSAELQPNDYSAILSYAKVLEKLGRFDEAFERLCKIRNAGFWNADVYNSKGNCLKQLRRFPEAEAEYRNAIRTSKDPHTAKYLNNLALLFAVWPDTSRLSEGVDLCEQIAREYPNFPWISMTLSELEGRRNQEAADPK